KQRNQVAARRHDHRAEETGQEEIVKLSPELVEPFLRLVADSDDHRQRTAEQQEKLECFGKAVQPERVVKNRNRVRSNEIEESGNGGQNCRETNPPQNPSVHFLWCKEVNQGKDRRRDEYDKLRRHCAPLV